MTTDTAKQHVTTQEIFYAVDGLVLIRAHSQGKRLAHVEVESVETVRGKVTGRPVKWAMTAHGARKLAEVLRRAARIAERGYATAGELATIAGEED